MKWMGSGFLPLSPQVWQVARTLLYSPLTAPRPFFSALTVRPSLSVAFHCVRFGQFRVWSLKLGAWSLEFRVPPSPSCIDM